MGKSYRQEKGIPNQRGRSQPKLTKRRSNKRIRRDEEMSEQEAKIVLISEPIDRDPPRKPWFKRIF